MVSGEGKRLEEKTYLCKDCTVLLTLAGALKNTFIVALSPEVEIECKVCKKNNARFFVSPYELGVTVCERCLDERGGKHAWHRFKKIDSGEHLTCDLCLSKNAIHLTPTPKDELPKALREEKGRRKKS
jgi:hypothetical protein